MVRQEHNASADSGVYYSFTGDDLPGLPPQPPSGETSSAPLNASQSAPDFNNPNYLNNNEGQVNTDTYFTDEIIHIPDQDSTVSYPLNWKRLRIIYLK